LKSDEKIGVVMVGQSNG